MAIGNRGVFDGQLLLLGWGSVELVVNTANAASAGFGWFDATLLDQPQSLTDTESDAVSVTDSVSVAAEIHLALSDSVNVTDAVAIELTVAISASDSVNVTDVTTPSLEFGITATDTVSVSDGTTVELDVLRAVSDTVSVTDSSVFEFTVGRDAADTIIVSDDLGSVADYSRSLLDELGLVGDAIIDSTVTEADFSRAIGPDEIGSSDETAVSIEVDRNVADTLDNTDVFNSEAHYERVAFDELGTLTTAIPDTLFIELELGLSDTVSVTDTVAVTTEISVDLSDAIDVTDGVSTGAEYSRSLLDELGLLSTAIPDALSTSAEYVRSAGDAVAVDDIALPAQTIEHILADSLTLVDVVASAVSISVAVSDTVTVADALNTAVERLAADSVVMSDSIGITVTYHVNATDTVSVSDIIEVGGESYDVLLSDAVDLEDLVEPLGNFVILDTVTVNDSVVASTETAGVHVLRELRIPIDDLEAFLAGAVVSPKLLFPYTVLHVDGLTLVFVEPVETLTFSDPGDLGMSPDSLVAYINANMVGVQARLADNKLFLYPTDTSIRLDTAASTAAALFGWNAGMDAAAKRYSYKGSYPRILAVDYMARREQALVSVVE